MSKLIGQSLFSESAAGSMVLAASSQPLVSVIILNYNGTKWLERCLVSLRAQTLFAQMEIILTDNLSADGSDGLGEKIMEGWPNGHFVQNGANLGFCEGNNRGAQTAAGKFLFFLNNDAWLEPDCLEILLNETEQARAEAATPLVLNFDDDSFQSLGASGFDLFGLAAARFEHQTKRDVFMPEGCSYLISRTWFEKLGGFDSVFFMFADELDLSWRLWLAGGKAIAVPGARLHHRGAANVNPKGGGTVVEFRTSDTKRFYANRNCLLTVLKNAKNVLLLMAALQVGLLAIEALAALVLVRRWGYVKKAYVNAVADCWRLRNHILIERARIKTLRRRSDWRMLRFFRLRLNRWDELRRLWKFGAPKITPS